MKITKKLLREMILNEMRRVRVSDDVYEADLDDLIRFADAYTSLGGAVQEQIKYALDSGDPGDIAPGAMSYIEDRLSGFNTHIDFLIQGYHDQDDDNQSYTDEEYAEKDMW